MRAMRKLPVVPICRRVVTLRKIGINAKSRASRLGKRDVRVVTNVRRDAMDAGGIVRRAMPLRTAKSCGPGAPGLALSVLMMINRRR